NSASSRKVSISAQTRSFSLLSSAVSKTINTFPPVVGLSFASAPCIRLSQPLGLLHLLCFRGQPPHDEHQGQEHRAGEGKPGHRTRPLDEQPQQRRGGRSPTLVRRRPETHGESPLLSGAV